MTSDARKGERHAHKTSETLPQGVIPPLDMGSFSRLFSHSGMLFLWDHRLIRCPEVCEAMTSTIEIWNGLPQPLTRLFTSIPNRIGHHLTRFTTQSNPHPGSMDFFEHKRPQFVQFQRRGRRIQRVRCEEGGMEGRKLSYFFMIQLDTVVRETPNVRVRPRRLLRS